MPISITSALIPDILIIEPKVFSDERGWFCESFNQKEFSCAVDKNITFVQDNHSFSRKGVLRGLHYQMNYAQGKLVRVCQGSVFDVVVDMRRMASSYGQWMGLELSSENKKQLWIPAGFAHGFLVLSDQAELLYKTTNYWDPASEQCLLWNDSTLNIQWPNIGMQPILNSKDLAGLNWQTAIKFE